MILYLDSLLSVVIDNCLPDELVLPASGAMRLRDTISALAAINLWRVDIQSCRCVVRLRKRGCRVAANAPRYQALSEVYTANYARILGSTFSLGNSELCLTSANSVLASSPMGRLHGRWEPR